MENVTPKYEKDMAQDEAEMVEFIRVLKSEQVKSYLEIGARYGASLWRVACSLPAGSRVVAVDMGTGWGGRPDGIEVLKTCLARLTTLGYDAHLIEGDSQWPQTVERAKRLGPFDCVFIDGQHNLVGVTADWRNYGPMARLVAFHDIAWKRAPEWMPHRKRIEVPKLWEKLKTEHPHREIKLHHTRQDNGIGILWRG